MSDPFCTDVIERWQIVPVLANVLLRAAAISVAASQ